MTASWEETTLPTLLARYQLKDIFHGDEFGLFYEALPSKSLHFRGKRCSGGKHGKVRLTGTAASNALSETIQMFVIGKSVNSRCFKHVSNLRCRYLSQKKAWMDGTFFDEWLRELDRKFEMRGRKTVMMALQIQKFQDWKLLNNNFCRQILLLVHSQWVRVLSGVFYPNGVFFQGVIRCILFYPNKQGFLPSIHVGLKSLALKRPNRVK